jgi:hypothetical protein
MYGEGLANHAANAACIHESTIKIKLKRNYMRNKLNTKQTKLNKLNKNERNQTKPNKPTLRNK